jgi:hypothetical protein
MIPVKLLFETDTGMWRHLTMLPALPTLDGRSVIAVGGLLFIPFEMTIEGHKQVVTIHVGGFSHLTNDDLEKDGWVEVESEAASQ